MVVFYFYSDCMLQCQTKRPTQATCIIDQLEIVLQTFTAPLPDMDFTTCVLDAWIVNTAADIT